MEVEPVVEVVEVVEVVGRLEVMVSTLVRAPRARQGRSSRRGAPPVTAPAGWEGRWSRVAAAVGSTSGPTRPSPEAPPAATV
ncbi:hypothetical protein GCM10023199_44740 [Actinomycetospora chibensis]